MIELTDDERQAVLWVRTLASLALEQSRLERIEYGHKFGSRKIGLHDFEVEWFEKAMAALDRICVKERP